MKEDEGVKLPHDATVIAAGGNHSVVALRKDGTVAAIGYNGDGGTIDVYKWENIISVSAGEHHTVGLKADGTVVATGGYCNTVKDSAICSIGKT